MRVQDLVLDGRFKERKQAVQEVLDDAGIEHFSANELYPHTSENWVYEDKLYPPPTGQAENIRDTIILADEIRERWGGPVRCISGHRSQTYNDLLRLADNEHQGSEDSQHLYFRALDLQPKNPRSEDYSDWRQHCEEIIEEHRDNGEIIGRGFYSTFVHIDTGRYSYQRNWDNRE